LTHTTTYGVRPWEKEQAAAAGQLCAKAVGSARTKKVLRNHIKYEATKEHPAQVEVFTEDEIAGFWSKVDFSGAIPAGEKNAMLARVRKLQESVKLARERANSLDVSDFGTGKPIMEYIFGSNGAI
jgi:hypothetical protein